ncbi:MAG: hypothetical protein OHK0011_21350 [Turneriella sp.]
MLLWQYMRSWPWWAISLSLGVNIILLLVAVTAITVFRDRVPVVVVSFLLFHIFIAQPLKDWLISRMGIHARYSVQTGFITFDNRVSRIMRLKDVLEFLGWLIRIWKLSRVRLLVFDDEDQVFFINRNKRVRRMRLKDDLSEEFRQELSLLNGAKPVTALSPALKTYMQSRRVRFVAPVLFRERLIGLIGLSEIIDRARLPLLDHAVHRIGLALENEQLERTVPRSEFLSKEFRLAEKIERHLSGASRYAAGRFTVQKLDTAWEKKHFSAIFGCAPSDDPDQETHFLMLLRLNVRSTRSNALQLFSTQGYFYSLVRGQRDVAGLAAELNRNLRVNENRSIVLEGFLMSLHSKENLIRLQAFGRHLAYRDDHGWNWIPETPPLGGEDFTQGQLIELRPRKDVIVSMREYPLLLISGGLA